jgi:uncharacterized surface protein with fasciclin (FAS1) repeats
MNRRIKLIAVAGAIVMVLAACGGDSGEGTATTDAPTTTEAMVATTEAPSTTEAAPDTTTGPDTTVAEADILETAVAAGDFTTLAAAVDAAGLTETLQGEGPFTVFAPTDAAFEAALADLDMTAEELLADTETLTSILTYHVISGEVPASDVLALDGQEVETVNGETVEISIDGETVMVDGATVVQPDVFASNGVIHVIDSVLLP